MSAHRPSFVPSALAPLALALLTFALPAICRSQATITPGTGYFEISAQVQVHVELCSTNSWFDAWGTILVNGEVAGSTTPGSSPGCNDFQSGDITVTVPEGTTTVSVTAADGNGPMNGQVTYTAPPPPPPPPQSPSIDVTPHNGYHWSSALSLMADFNNVATYSTPAYVSMDEPRTVTLRYSSGQVQGRHTIQVNVTNRDAAIPDNFYLRLRRADNSYVTFTNGSTTLYFQGWIYGTTHRVAAVFDDTTLATGAYSYTVVVGGQWGTQVADATAPIRLLVLNERSSPYGAGWTVAGAARLKIALGDSLAFWDGAGSVEFWRRTACDATGCTFSPPAGTFDRVRFTNSGSRTDSVAAYVRTLTDGTMLTLDDLGRIRYAEDRFGNRTTFTWLDAQRLHQIVDPAGKIISFGYDGSNRLASIRDSVGHRTTTFTINPSNDLVQIQDPAGGKPFQAAVYDGSHRLVAVTNRRGDLWKYGYDGAGKLAADTSPSVTVNGASQRLLARYNAPVSRILAAGSVLADTAGVALIWPTSGALRKVKVDAFGAPLLVMGPAAEFALFTRNADGQITSALDSTGSQTFRWTGPRLLCDSNTITHAYTRYEWDTTYSRVMRQYGSAPEVRNWYGANGRLDSTRVGIDTPAVRYTYDSRGRVLTVRAPSGLVVQTFYSATGLFNTDSVKAGSRRSAVYHDSLGRTIAVKDPANRVDSTQYDVLNRIKRTAGPLGRSITYTYGDSLNVTSMTDGKGQVYAVEKNAVGWDTARVDPAGQKDFYAYDWAGHVTRWTNRRGQATTLSYDTLGRVAAQGLADGRGTTFASGYTWFADSSAEGQDSVRWVADTIYEIAVRGGVAYRVRSFLNAAGRYSTLDFWRSGQTPISVRYDIDTVGRATKITVPDEPGTAYADVLRYNSDGLHQSVDLHGLTSLDRSYRPGHDLATATPGSSLLNFRFMQSYAQDSLGRTVEKVGPSTFRFERYVYDSLNRITTFERWSASTACPIDSWPISEFGPRCYPNRSQLLAQSAYTYDAAGNRTDGSAAIGTGNRLARFNGDSLLYDFDGNLIRRYRLADSSVFNQRLYWNSAGQLDSVRTVKAGVAQVAKFGYDGEGRRVRKTVGSTTTYYVYSGAHVVAQYDSASGTLQRRYTYYPGSDQPHSVWIGSDLYYFIGDGKGNVQGLIRNIDAAVMTTYRYTPFGETDSVYETGITNNIRFAGRELDPETGLYYNRARYYDPQLGRFISEDPLRQGAANAYAYAGNDALNARDPSGAHCEVRQDMARSNRDRGADAAWPNLGQVTGTSEEDRSAAAEPGSESSGAGAGTLVCDDLTPADIWVIVNYLRAAWGIGNDFPEGFFDDPLFLNNGRGLDAGLANESLDYWGATSGSERHSSPTDVKYRFQTTPVAELRGKGDKCVQEDLELRGVRFKDITVTIGGVPYLGSGTGRLDVGYIRDLGYHGRDLVAGYPRSGYYALYGQQIGVNFDEPIKDLNELGGGGFAKVHCESGIVVGSGLGVVF